MRELSVTMLYSYVAMNCPLVPAGSLKLIMQLASMLTSTLHIDSLLALPLPVHALANCYSLDKLKF